MLQTWFTIPVFVVLVLGLVCMVYDLISASKSLNRLEMSKVNGEFDYNLQYLVFNGNFAKMIRSSSFFLVYLVTIVALLFHS